MTEFRDLLFADQTLEDLMGGLHNLGTSNEADGECNPWNLFQNAYRALSCSKTEEAKKALLQAASLRHAESRIVLWAWSNLRQLGVQPDSATACHLLGVILELPLESGVDTLAAYADGSARYANRVGSIIVWDMHDKMVGSIVRHVLHTAKPLMNQATAPDRHVLLPPGFVRFNFLTPGGNYFAEEGLRMLDSGASPFNPLFIAGTQLMVSLIQLAQKRVA